MTTNNTPTRWVNNPFTWEKFDTRGRALRHRGSTLISYLVADSPLYEVCGRILDDIHAEGCAPDFGLLPLSSMHMTVFPGLKDPSYLNQRELWPEGIDVDQPFTETVQQLRQRLVVADIRAPQHVTMIPKGVYPLHQSLTIEQVPATAADAAELHRFRTEVAAAFGFPAPVLGEYRFHTSLGYRLTRMTQESREQSELLEQRYSQWVRQAGATELEPVAFCAFNDMLSFAPILHFRA
ncbi:DUF1868 domain-containing protein [Corynebacterium uterequi]|uniref:DUF1868 domain-containing protein n=1 Tax=Corynebacterium uterequi TaxID=1072256 RepID=A0A0G3HE95_9CORY|nr:DUF1868 domain-containing protein [Corynebacterium uterequi]AKK11636.1 hypothetical protein CUTER_08255 [Corynebacterium uterequi]